MFASVVCKFVNPAIATRLFLVQRNGVYFACLLLCEDTNQRLPFFAGQFGCSGYFEAPLISRGSFVVLAFL